jgi:hypothetical protein
MQFVHDLVEVGYRVHALLVSGLWLLRSHFLEITPERSRARGMFAFPAFTMTESRIASSLAAITANVRQIAQSTCCGAEFAQARCLMCAA